MASLGKGDGQCGILGEGRRFSPMGWDSGILLALVVRLKNEAMNKTNINSLEAKLLWKKIFSIMEPKYY